MPASTAAIDRSACLRRLLTSPPDWKEPFREGVVYYLKDGRVRGVLLWNTWGHVERAALIAERGPFTPRDLKGRLPRGS